MTPSHARKRGIRYRYYLSFARLQGQPECCGSVGGASAVDVEALVIKSVREHRKLSPPIDDRGLIAAHVARVEIQLKQLAVELPHEREPNQRLPHKNHVLHVLRQKISSKRGRDILLPVTALPQEARLIRSGTRATLIASIARGRRWLDELITDPTARFSTCPVDDMGSRSEFSLLRTPSAFKLLQSWQIRSLSAPS